MIDRIEFSTGVAAGSAGAATATGYSAPVSGRVLAVHVAYVDSPPTGSTDATLKDENDPGGESILTLTNSATAGKHYPRRTVNLNDGTALTYDSTEPVAEPYVVHGRLAGTIAGANAGDSITFTVWIER